MPFPTWPIMISDMLNGCRVNTGGSYSYSGPVSVNRMCRASSNPNGSFSAADNFFSSTSMDGVRGKRTPHEYFTTYLYWDSRNPACCRMDLNLDGWGGTAENTGGSNTFSYWYSRADVWKVDANHNAGYYSYRLRNNYGGAWAFNGVGQIMWTAAYLWSGYNPGGGVGTVFMWAAPYDGDVYANSPWANRYAIAQYYKRFILYPIYVYQGGGFPASCGFYLSRYRAEWYVHGNDWGWCVGALGIGDRYATPTFMGQTMFSNYDGGFGWYNGSGPFSGNYNQGGNYYIGGVSRDTRLHIEQMGGGDYGYMSGWIFQAIMGLVGFNTSTINNVFATSASGFGFPNQTW